MVTTPKPSQEQSTSSDVATHSINSSRNESPASGMLVKYEQVITGKTLYL